MATSNSSPRRTTGSAPTVSMGFVTGILAGIGRTGLSQRELLEHAGIASNLIHQRHARIPVARYAALYRLINDSLDDEGFALFSRPLRRGSFELLCRAVLSAPTLEAALDRIARSLRVLLDDFSVELETGWPRWAPLT